MLSRRSALLAIGLLAAGLVTPALVTPVMAAEKVHVAIGQRGLWDTLLVPVGIEAGIFKKHNLEVEVTWTAGGSETLQAIISGSAQYALTNGTTGVLAAYEKGAPVRIISNESRGTGDIFWYVKADNPIKSLKDAGGKTMAFSRPGSSTHFISQQLVKQAGTAVKLVSGGAMPAVRTQVMSGQIDIGWAAPPMLLEQVKSGEVRIVARGSDLTAYKNESIRVNAANADYLKQRPAVHKAFMAAYVETLDWMYNNMDKFLEIFARENKISIDVARAAAEFYPKETITPYPVGGIQNQIKEALEAKQITKPLTDAQIAELVQAPMK